MTVMNTQEPVFLASRIRAHGGDDLAGLTLDGQPIDQPPASMDAAQAEINSLIASTQMIDQQLTDQRAMGHRFTSAVEFDDWRRRTIAAKRLKVFRLRFLKQWVKAQNGHGLPRAGHDPSWTTAPKTQLDDISVSSALRQLARRAGQLEAVYYAALRHVEQNTDATWTAFLDVVTRAESVIGGIPASLLDKEMQ